VKNIVGLNLAPEPKSEPTGEIWHSNPNPSGFWCSSGFVNEFLSEFFGFFGFFLVSLGFRVFFRFQVFFSDFRFFEVSDFFRFRVHPRVKNKTHTRTRFCMSQVQIRVMGAKTHPNPHPSGAKPMGDSKPEPELPSLTASYFVLIDVYMKRTQ
jgi:hypothetical protein